MVIRKLTEYAKKKWGYTSENFASDFTPTAKTPPWLITAKNYIGTKEIPGPRSNPVIIGWAKKIGGWVANYFKDDDIPWCGLFVAECLRANNVDISNIKNILGAQQWKNLGFSTEPRFGAVMVFWRRSKSSGLGHVGFYISEDKDFYHILGGNQSNSVNIAKVAKNRLIDARWPNGFKTLHAANAGRIVKPFDGKISIDES